MEGRGTDRRGDGGRREDGRRGKGRWGAREKRADEGLFLRNVGALAWASSYILSLPVAWEKEEDGKRERKGQGKQGGDRQSKRQN